MDDPTETNREYWDELAAVHPETDHYDVEGFLDGASSLRNIERGELADEAGLADRARFVEADVYDLPGTLDRRFDVVSAVAGAGLCVEHLHEFPKLGFRHYDAMTEDDDGWWRLPDGPELPLTYSLRARKSSTPSE